MGASEHRPVFRYCPGNGMEELRKTMTNHQHSWPPVRDLKSGPPEYEI
jgi:hypothetical protein